MHFSLRNQLQESFSNAALPPEEPKPVVADVESGFKTVFEGKPDGEPLIPTEQVVQKGCGPDGKKKPMADAEGSESKPDDEDSDDEMSEEDKKKKVQAKKEEEPRFAVRKFDLNPLPVQKFNPNHDKNGRFASGGAGGAGSGKKVYTNEELDKLIGPDAPRDVKEQWMDRISARGGIHPDERVRGGPLVNLFNRIKDSLKETDRGF